MVNIVKLDQALRLYVEEPSVSVCEITDRTGISGPLLRYHCRKRGIPVREKPRPIHPIRLPPKPSPTIVEFENYLISVHGQVDECLDRGDQVGAERLTLKLADLARLQELAAKFDLIPLPPKTFNQAERD